MAILYGHLNMADLADQRVTTVGVDLITDAVERSVAEHNRQMDALLSLFVMRTTKHQGRYWSPASARLQPLDNAGRALPVKPSGKYDLAWPIQMGGTAWGYDYVTGQKLTVGEVARMTATMMDADMRWVRDHLLAALFYLSSTNPWSFVDEEWGTLSVYGLANGDSVTYSILSGADSQAADTHLKGTAAPAVATFTDIWTELTEHPENGGDVIALVPTNQVAAIEALSTFYPIEDPDLRVGMASAVLAGRLGAPVPGVVRGKVEKVWIVEWRSVPDDYAIAVTTEGERPLAMREDMEASLRGFKQVAEREDHPWYERQYLRRAGFGSWNRVGAVVYRLNNATYVTPTGYSSPMG